MEDSCNHYAQTEKGPYGVIILLNEVALRREKKLWLELNITP